MYQDSFYFIKILYLMVKTCVNRTLFTFISEMFEDDLVLSYSMLLLDLSILKWEWNILLALVRD